MPRRTARTAAEPPAPPAPPPAGPTVTVHVERGALALRAEGVAWGDRERIARALLDTLRAALDARPEAAPSVDCVPGGFAVYVPEPWEEGGSRPAPPPVPRRVGF